MVWFNQNYHSKMKLMLTVLVAALATLVYGANEKAKCLSEAGLTEIDDSKLVDDPKVKKYVVCLGKEYGLFDASDNLMGEVIRKRYYRLFIDPKKVDEAYNDCVVKKDTLEDTAFHFYTCTEKYAKVWVRKVPTFATDPCVSRTGISKEAYSKWHLNKNFEGDADATIKEYFLCFLGEADLGFLDASGNFVEDKVKNEFFTFSFNKEKSDALYKECAVKKDTPQETAFQFMKCLSHRVEDMKQI